MLVAEVIMIPETTALLAEATKRGCPIHLGRHMLDEQIRIMAEYILGKDAVPPPR
jgi:shikimate dehydrogenase